MQAHEIMSQLTPRRIKLFMSKIERGEGCWKWRGSTGNHGYGLVSMGRSGNTARLETAHRISWTLAYGPPLGRQHVLHKCGNRDCCNPLHMYIGVDADNVRDKVEAGNAKGGRGERHWKARLSESDVCSIRERRAAGELGTELARIFGVSTSTIYALTNGKTWGHVGGHSD